MDSEAQQMVSVSEQRDRLSEKFQDRIEKNFDLGRRLVSFQANKKIPFYSWFKYKEGFAAPLVEYFIAHFGTKPGTMLDPFAGVGAGLFVSAIHDWDATGIELLPVGRFAIQARLAARSVDSKEFGRSIDDLRKVNFSKHFDSKFQIEHIPITQGAFPESTELAMVGYISYIMNQFEESDLRTLLLFAAFSILEPISFTRKDGQYLRWDHRSGRTRSSKVFDKGMIQEFETALFQQLELMLADISGNSVNGQLTMFDCSGPVDAEVNMISGSCLKELPKLQSNSVNLVVTSPPYCNRYDYTRTYALELVFLGCSKQDVNELRQTMLSCTVENKSKELELKTFYESLGRIGQYSKIHKVFENQLALHEVLGILNRHRDEGILNNKNITNLVHNYFYEMCFVIAEIARVLKKGGRVYMVNDNVRYSGEEVPVDLILSDFAESFGLRTDVIWTLPRGKGNSSQQMGDHGRSELRKCVYVWSK